MTICSQSALDLQEVPLSPYLERGRLVWYFQSGRLFYPILLPFERPDIHVFLCVFSKLSRSLFFTLCDRSLPTVEHRFALINLVALFAVLTRSFRQRVCIIVKFTGPMLALEVIVLESFKPPSHLSFGILHLKEPCKGYLIGSN